MGFFQKVRKVFAVLHDLPEHLRDVELRANLQLYSIKRRLEELERAIKPNDTTPKQ